MQLKRLLVLILVVLLSSCTNPPIDDTVDCGLFPEHEDCVQVVDCDVTPQDPSCEQPVDCTTTPNHPDCIVVKEDILSCEEQALYDCKFIYAEALYDNTFTTINTYETLKEADLIMEESTNLNMVVLFQNNVVAMKYGAINFNTKTSSETTILGRIDFKNPTYLNGYYNVDGLFLDTNGIFTRGMIAGVAFEVLTSEVKLIPHIQSRNGYSYYQNVNNELVHYSTRDIVNQSFQSLGAFDQAPSYLDENNKYYSYDGHYFFENVIDMTDDYNNGDYIHSINKDTPYYNYYQYLSFRSKTNYTAEELNTYINANVNISSAIYNKGDQFIQAQDDVFINGAMELAFAIHESGWGSSTIAKVKNNLFGINAIDSDPFTNAYAFDTIADCIVYHVEHTMQARYFNPMYNVSYGTNFGNKSQGMNYKYASDAYWGEKIAKHYYRMDKALGFKDYNQYTIILLEPEALGYYGPGIDEPIIYNPSLYTYYGLTVPFVVVKETEDFYALQLPLGLNDNFTMSIDETMDVTDIFYVLKTQVTLVN